jgi:GxxExxY protein
VSLECGYRIDFLIEDRLVVEIKSVDALLPIFDAQILTYMRLADKPLGLLMNFNAQTLKDGLRRFVR